jgi:prepilin-type N-terminal cleavage/methylation domain-containing protein
MTSCKGFTLIELSVVLVIIGLLVGGVLVGRELIETARLRQQITQIGDLNTAINTFRLKYNGLPGDLLASTAIGIGMTSRSGPFGHGDGDSIIEACSNGSSGIAGGYFGCETALFWNDLSAAGLIGYQFTSATDALLTVPAGQQSLYFPNAKINPRASILVFSESCEKGNCFSLARIDQISAGGAYGVNNAAVSPQQAFAIDSKMDDGEANTGRVRGGISPPVLYIFIWAFPVDFNECLMTDAGLVVHYDLASSAHDTPSCIMNFALQ